MEDGAQSITMKMLFEAGTYPGEKATLQIVTLPVPGLSLVQHH